MAEMEFIFHLSVMLLMAVQNAQRVMPFLNDHVIIGALRKP